MGKIIKMTDLLPKAKKRLLKESTYVKGKLNVLLFHAKKYLFDEGDYGKQTIWHKWTREGFIENVTQSFSIKKQIEDGNIKQSDINKFEKDINKAFDTLKKDITSAHKKWEKSMEKATKPFDKEYTGV